MAGNHSTGHPPGIPSNPQSVPIPVRHGELVHVVGGVAFADFRRAVCAWSAAEAHRIDIVDQVDALTVQRAVALVEMRDAGSDLLRFRAASRRESFLAAKLRRLRRQGGAQ